MNGKNINNKKVNNKNSNNKKNKTVKANEINKSGKITIILMGPQGCGKGTQAKLLSEKLKIPHISSGDLLRQEIAAGTPEGKKADSYMRQGMLVPSELITDIIKSRIKLDDCKNGFILEGYPRKLEQANELDKFVGLKKIILIDISNEESVRRLSSRMQCPKCGRIYGADLPPAYDKVCDLDGTKLFIRNDDKPEAIRKRLEMYHGETEPIIKFYEAEKNLARINGAQKVEKVLEDTLKAIQ